MSRLLDAARAVAAAVTTDGLGVDYQLHPCCRATEKERDLHRNLHRNLLAELVAAVQEADA